AGVSTTFHGRDIFAPAAGRLARGMPADVLGRPAGTWVDLGFGMGRRDGGVISGEVIYVDAFGNLITNIPASLLNRERAPMTVTVRRRSFRAAAVRTYGDLERGIVGVVPGSDGMLEIALREGDAAGRTGASAGERVVIRLQQGRFQPGKVPQTRRRRE
ncbi:MAG: SAM hydrolase/SAM-dependent halogenase family protein, partial [Gammaproteobacteria bacterium]